ncbi:MAG: hypothetical protein K0S77_3272, partial [Pseudomonas sp.]|nr:hypothetical protein [Pseudomonas sp.]
LMTLGLTTLAGGALAHPARMAAIAIEANTRAWVDMYRTILSQLP